jgi:hypothetical protein
MVARQSEKGAYVRSLNPSHGRKRDRRVVATISAAAVAAFSIAAATVVAAVTPVSPAPGSTVTESQPTFRWTLPPDEAADRIIVALAPDILPSGEFVDANIFDFDDLQPTATSWQTERKLFAGSYWWMVKSHTGSGPAQHVEYTPPLAFTVRLDLRLLSVRLKRIGDREAIRVGWFANAEHVKVDARVARGKRAIWTDEDAASGSLTENGASRFVFSSRAARPRAQLRLTVVVSALNQKRTKTLLFRAP